MNDELNPDDIITPDDTNLISDDDSDAGHSSYHVPVKDSKLHLSGMFQNWFIDYASYVILERAVPHLQDGLKPVQRRILHSMKELDDGRYNKVANVVGNTMKYHPHGDASIGDALVQLGQKGYLIDCQGNWGNILTGDSAAAPRYIEARLSEFALDVLYSPKVTEWTPSYDGRNKEPVTLPVKFPLLLAQGAEGIAVGLSCRILPHNFGEIIDAAIAHLKGEPFELFPDFPTGGFVDVSRYNDGEREGRVRVRTKIEKKDNKTLIISDLPYGKTTSSLIESIIKAGEKGKIKIRSVDDNTSDHAEIIVHLQAGVSSDKTIDALYAFTDCEVSLAPICCVIKDHKPNFLTVSQLLRFSVEHTKEILLSELQVRIGELQEQLLFASLEKIFIEERIYKDRQFEQAASMDIAVAHVDKRLEPFKPSFFREITRDDILKLMEIPMRRILKFSSDKAETLIANIQEKIAKTNYDIEHIIDFTIHWYEYLKEKYADKFPRRTIVRGFDTIVAAKVAEANEKLYINREEGFIGIGSMMKKDEYVCPCSDIDDIIIFFRNGKYKVIRVADKLYVGKDVLYINVFKRNDERTIYNVLYRDGRGGAIFMKRFNITGITRDREYDLTQGKPNSKIVWFSANPNGEAEVLRVTLRSKPRLKVLQFDVDFANLGIKGRSTRGNLVTKNEVHRITLKEQGTSTLGGREVWLDNDVLRLNYDGRGVALGEFSGNDLVLVVLNTGECYCSSFDSSNHYEDGILRIEKFKEGKVWTAVLFDAEQGENGLPYIKRFTIEPSQKKQRFIGDNPKSRLISLSDNPLPRYEVKFGGSDANRESIIIDAEEFIAVKSMKAKGRRVSNYEIDQITEIEPRQPEITEEPEPAPAQEPQTEAPDAGQVLKTHGISQQKAYDEQVGQMRIFDDEDL